MGWLDFMHLLERHGGDFQAASDDEIEAAAKANPNTPDRALQEARRKYSELTPQEKGERQAIALAHDLEEWQAGGIAGLPRRTCKRCGASVLVNGAVVYGSAIERRCTPAR